MHDTSTYTYKPLSPDENDGIRLLHLEPGTGDDAIRFTLRPVRLSQAPTHEALSYCWGDPTDTVDVLCDGKHMSITANLHAALRRLRYDDAACIDQANVP